MGSVDVPDCGLIVEISVIEHHVAVQGNISVAKLSHKPIRSRFYQPVSNVMS